jgi:UDP-3-O-[3-hydroxymyristoyl] glucosamine N-acyltransferase
MPSFTLASIAKQLNGQFHGDPDLILTGFAPADTAKSGDLTFAENDSYFERAVQSAASAILVAGEYACDSKALIQVPNARVAFAQILPLFFPEPKFLPGVHPLTVIAPSAVVDPSAHIGPFCSIGERSSIGPGVVVESHASIGEDCHLGEGCRLFPHVTLYSRTVCGRRVRLHAGVVIGSDGFGYVFDQGTHRKVPQVGCVVLQDDVEIGANTTIDRAALGSTVIGKGTKIDNLVQIGHNVTVGDHGIIVAQVGIAGSTRIGSYTTIAGQAGLAGHLRIGDRVTIAAKAGVMTNIPDGQKWLGAPAQPDRVAKRQLLAVERLPELLRRVHELEKQLGSGSVTPES